MSLDRIQKLLFSEYSDFEDMVLIESPFVEITKTGFGLRQLQIGLTATKLIMANEIMRKADEYPIFFYPGQIDPEIETMELISIFPIELVSLSVWQRRRRKVLKARFHDGNPKTVPRIVYFELGGLEKKRMFWNLWCEKIRFLTPTPQCESATEPSVASSTSIDSIQLAYTKIAGNQIWNYYDSAYHPPDDMIGELTSRFLANCKEVRSSNDSLEVKTIFINQQQCDNSASSESSQLSSNTARVNRFSEGIDEQCATGLYLPTVSYVKSTNNEIRARHHFKNFDEFCHTAVKIWATSAQNLRPLRLYGISPCSDLNYGAGLLGTDRAGRYSMQLKRSQSLVSLVEERLHVLEVEELHRQQKTVVGSQSSDLVGNRTVSHQLTPDDHILYFWTTDYWYKPDKITRNLAHWRARKPEEVLKTRKRIFFGLKKTKVSADGEEKLLAKMRATMKMKQQVSAWDLDSGALASQLTITDAALFLKVTVQELRMIKKQGSARNCKNFMTWLIFSHRIACLVATQILLTPDSERRARLISRFIIVCERCDRLSNHQSVNSVLHGLQSPAIYRLYATWSRVRQYHSTAYNTFKKLTKQYKMATLPNLAKPPYLPSAKFYLDTLLGRLWPQQADSPDDIITGPLQVTKVDEPARSMQKIMLQFMSIFNITPCGGSSIAILEQDPSVHVPDHSGDQSALSLASSPSCPGLPEAEGILRASQHAARKYSICHHRDAQEFLQKMPYQEHYINFQLSLRVEPPR